MTRAALAIRRFRLIALSEAVSYLLLLAVAMPLKYICDWPLGVRIVGMIHGLLFILFCVTLAWAMQLGRWPLRRGVSMFLASFVPLLPFWLDAELRRWEHETAQGEG
jgi:integral membrane protein